MGAFSTRCFEEAQLFQYALADDDRVVRFQISSQDVVEAVEHPSVPALFAPKSEITPVEILGIDTQEFIEQS